LNNLECSRNNHLLRCVFVASRLELENPRLRLLLRAPSGQNSKARFLCPAGVPSRRIWIDAGANPGELTFAAAEADSNLRVYAFEPKLAGAVERMGQIPNFIVLPLALAGKDGSSVRRIGTPGEGASGECVPGGLEEFAAATERTAIGGINLPSLRLDTFLNHAKVDRVELLRIAVEDEDLAAVLPEASLSSVERIDLELWSVEGGPERAAFARDNAIAYLETAGFELERSSLRTDGKAGDLTFVRFSYEDAAAIPVEARDIAYLRPLLPRPGWHFGIDWDNPDPYVRRRRRIWSFCNRKNLHLPVEFDWYYGLKLTVYLGNDITRALFVGGDIDPNEFAFLDRFLRPGMVVADAGANEGLYTLFAAKRVGDKGSVLAFEPSARELSRLRSNIERNSLNNVNVFPVALGEAEDLATFRVSTESHSGQNTLGEFIYEGVGLSSEVLTTVRPLDSVLAENHIARLDFLKVDVEGSETRLLRGAARTIREFRPVLLLEVADAALRKQSSSSEELLDLVQSFGYLLYRFDDGTGLPTLARPGETAVNMIAVPKSNPLPEEWCARTPSVGPKQIELTRLSGEFPLFSLAAQRIFNNSQVSGTGPVFVSTPPQQWSFAVGFPVNEKAWQMIGPLSEIRVRLELEVDAGEVGIGIVNRELSAYLAPEMRYGPSSDIVCEIALSYLPPDSVLVLRNTAISGVVSKATVRSIAAFVVAD
jgi:FkbM family methyltransferase